MATVLCKKTRVTETDGQRRNTWPTHTFHSPVIGKALVPAQRASGGHGPLGQHAMPESNTSTFLLVWVVRCITYAMTACTLVSRWHLRCGEQVSL